MSDPYSTLEETDLTIVIVSFVIVTLVTTILAWFSPIRDADDEHMRGLSVVTAICLFPVYLLVVAYQNPIRTSRGKPNPLPTLLITLLIGPLVLCFLPRDGWNKNKGSFGSGA